MISLHASLPVFAAHPLTLPVHSASPVKWLLAGCDAADSVTAVVAPQGSYALKNHMGLYCVQLYRHSGSITRAEKKASISGDWRSSYAPIKFEQNTHHYTMSEHIIVFVSHRGDIFKSPVATETWNQMGKKMDSYLWKVTFKPRREHTNNIKINCEFELIFLLVTRTDMSSGSFHTDKNLFWRDPKVTGALCSFREEIQLQNFNIYNINEEIIQTLFHNWINKLFSEEN